MRPGVMLTFRRLRPGDDVPRQRQHVRTDSEVCIAGRPYVLSAPPKAGKGSTRVVSSPRKTEPRSRFSAEKRLFGEGGDAANTEPRKQARQAHAALDRRRRQAIGKAELRRPPFCVARRRPDARSVGNPKLLKYGRLHRWRR